MEDDLRLKVPELGTTRVVCRTGDPSRNRDVCRTPMPWRDEPGGGSIGVECSARSSAVSQPPFSL